MAVSNCIAKTAAGISRGLLRNLAHTNGSNLPGRIALKIDNSILATEVEKRISGKKMIVVGTNGKTSVTNLIADIVCKSGSKVICNRSGANMRAGITSTVLQSKSAEVGVFESDELWLRESIYDIKPDYVLLLNLFRDQLDRCGEIERIQSSIIESLKICPRTTLIYNADDPLCVQVALGVNNSKVAFGVGEPLNIAQNSVTDAQVCQMCDSMLKYNFNQYDKLGDFYCESCSFKRPNCDWTAKSVEMAADGINLEIVSSEGDHNTYKSHLVGAYNVYNLIASIVAGGLLGASYEEIQEGLSEFNPKNGRLESFVIDGKKVLLNLAKNPTGFNQNLRIVGGSVKSDGRCAIAFFINDLTADGHDISWIWDVDFEELADIDNAAFYAGGLRKHDLQVRLKYAGISATIIDDVSEVITEDVESVFVVANYTALPRVKKSLEATASAKGKSSDKPPRSVVKDIVNSEEPLRIAHILPELLNLYGDGGNLTILKKRCEWRGIPCHVERVTHESNFDLGKYDLIFLGGGPDREQRIATNILLEKRDNFVDYVDRAGVLLAICGGYQILGHTWLLGDSEVPGLGILDIKTVRPGTSADRCTSNIALKTKIIEEPVVGFENHAGRTYLGDSVEPFGRTISKIGVGNNEEDRADGVLYKNVIGTYLHGSLLSKNPGIADYLLELAIERYKKRTGKAIELKGLDDSEETDARDYMIAKIC